MKINPLTKLIEKLRVLSNLPLTDTNNQRNHAHIPHKPHLIDKRVQVKNNNQIPRKYLRHS